MNIDNVKTRIAEQEDWQVIIDIYNEAILEGKKTADLEIVTIEERKEWLNFHLQKKYPIFVAEIDEQIIGWCSISPYRPGRKALDSTAEISYYIKSDFRQKGIASFLMKKSFEFCGENGIENLFAILLEVNLESVKILEKFGFENWGYFPKVAKIKEGICGQFIYGKNL